MEETKNKVQENKISKEKPNKETFEDPLVKVVNF
jgi:hypothetical protein